MNVEVLLINPPSGRSVGIFTEHLGLAYLAGSLLSAGISVEVLDTYIGDLTMEALLKQLQTYSTDPLLVGFTVITKQAWFCVQKISKRIRQIWPDTLIVLGGYFATFWYDKLLECPEVDIIVRGEGEETIVDLVQCVRMKKELSSVKGIAFQHHEQLCITSPRPLVSRLDSLPFPYRPHLEEIVQKGGTPTIYGSRGCLHQCSFCQVAQMYRHQPGKVYRYRSINNIIAELRQISNRLQTCTISFTDDEFIGSTKNGQKRARQLGDQIIAHGLDVPFAFQCRADSIDIGLLGFLRQAGLNFVSFGLESMVQRSLKLFDKHVSAEQNFRAIQTLEALEIDYSIGVILYDPYTTFEELQETLDWLHKLPCFPLSLAGLGILRGTPIEKYFRQTGMLIERDMSLEVLPKEPALRTFHHSLRRYAEIYTTATNNLVDTWMLLLAQKRLPGIWRHTFNRYREYLRQLHLYFLDEVLKFLKKDVENGIAGVLNEMEEEFVGFTCETEFLLRDLQEHIQQRLCKTGITGLHDYTEKKTSR